MTQKHNFRLVTLLIVAVVLAGLLTGSVVPCVQAQGGSETSFTYQGNLERDGDPVNAECEMVFRLYDAVEGGTQVGDSITRVETVSNGLFSTELDFGDVFDGTACWLDIEVSCDGDSGYTDLGRQALTAMPYALYAHQASWFGLTDVPAGFADGVDDASSVISGTALIAGDGLTQEASGDEVTMSVDFAGSGSADKAARSDHDHAGEYWYTTEYEALRLHAIGRGLTALGQTGVYGEGSAYGLAGIGDQTGTYGGGDSQGVWGYSDSGYAVYSEGDFHATGDITADGSKSAVVDTENYGKRKLYAVESSEVWFEDIGSGQLVDGEATVTIDPIFAQTVNLDKEYHVFVQVYGDAEVYVTDRTPTQFEVRLREGSSDVEFSYRLVAKRQGYEEVRLEELGAKKAHIIETTSTRNTPFSKDLDVHRPR